MLPAVPELIRDWHLAHRGPPGASPLMHITQYPVLQASYPLHISTLVVYGAKEPAPLQSTAPPCDKSF